MFASRRLPFGNPRRAMVRTTMRAWLLDAIRVAAPVAILLTTILPAFIPLRASAAELLVLEESNWDEVAPRGKEVDCILGDLVLRNDRITAVIARPIPGRHANMTTRNVGGAVVDLTSRHDSNDQLTAFHPGAGEFAWRAKTDAPPSASGSEVTLLLESPATDQRPAGELIYRLRDGEAFLRIETRYSNPHAAAIQAALQDAVRLDGAFQFRFQPETKTFTGHDEWWHQAYGLRVAQAAPTAVGDSVTKKRPLLSYQPDGVAQATLAPQQSLELTRELFPAPSSLELRGRMAESRNEAGAWVEVHVRDARGPVALARVELLRDGQPIGHSRTNAQGQLRLRADSGEYQLRITANGRPEQQARFAVATPVPATQRVDAIMDLPGYVDARVTDSEGQPIPCKVEFRGVNGTASPEFGPNTFENAVRNLVYTADGTFRQEIAPGRYEVIISHGPEYDAVFTSLEVRRGEAAELVASLRHSVATPGWISSDFHSHSTPSGDNTSSQRGRVLNLLAEHLEFAPCTEHNRISTYVPHLEELQATGRMATCSGIEVTGNQLPVNHQNAFPLVHKPRTQDGGGPDSDDNPVVQVERLALWDQRASKVVQANHPNLMQILGDRDLDGQADGGFERMFASMDVIEVHPPAGILQYPTSYVPADAEQNPIFHWLQLLNQGYRIPGVVNTDAHYNFHGSGFLRNYMKSPTDEPGKILTADMVRAAEAGHMIMTNGPYLEVEATSNVAGEQRTAIAGDDLVAGRDLTVQVRVQCANWLDVNRVFVLLNGRPVPELDFRRATHADRFQSQVVKFEARLPVTIGSDAHLIVVAVGEGLKLGPVAGPDHENDLPIAVSNPIFLDTAGDGFQPNGDTLDVPLPRD